MRLIAVLLLASAFAGAQQEDVAAAARANRQNQPAQNASSHVYTNDDLGYGHPKDNDKARGKQLAKLPKDKQEQARKIIRQILQQRQQIAKLQDHDQKLQEVASARAKLETPPQLTPALCAESPEQCETRHALLMDLARTSKQLEAAKKKLDELQDSAHRQGYPPSVFDP